MKCVSGKCLEKRGSLKRCCLFSFMDIGWPAAVHGMADGGMLGQLVLQIHHGFGAADKEDGISVVQAPYLVRGEQLFATMSSDEFKKGKKITPLH